MAHPANTHRSSWLVINKSVYPWRKTPMFKDFPSESTARADLALLRMTDPECAACVTPIIPKQPKGNMRPEKIGPGHPQRRGERRLTA